MARHLGKEGSVANGANAIGEVKNFDVDVQRSIAQGIALGDTWMSADYGDGSWTGTVTCHMDPDDTNGQNALRTAAIAGTKITLNLYVEGTDTGDFLLTGSVCISNLRINVSANGEYTEGSFSFTGDGAPSETTVGA